MFNLDFFKQYENSNSQLYESFHSLRPPSNGSIFHQHTRVPTTSLWHSSDQKLSL